DRGFLVRGGRRSRGRRRLGVEQVGEIDVDGDLVLIAAGVGRRVGRGDLDRVVVAARFAFLGGALQVLLALFREDRRVASFRRGRLTAIAEQRRQHAAACRRTRSAGRREDGQRQHLDVRGDAVQAPQPVAQRLFVFRRQQRRRQDQI